MAPSQTNLLQGTLDLLILKALGEGEMHGLGISRRIDQITQGTFQVKPGSLFPALHRMEEAGWLTSFWGESENNRRAKYYRRTKAGERQVGIETKQWNTIAGAMANALKVSGGGHESSLADKSRGSEPPPRATSGEGSRRGDARLCGRNR
jgi:transcriptional regulator